MINNNVFIRTVDGNLVNIQFITRVFIELFANGKYAVCCNISGLGGGTEILYTSENKQGCTSYMYEHFTFI